MIFLTLDLRRGPLRGTHVRDGAFSQEFQGYSFSRQLVLSHPHFAEASLAEEFRNLNKARVEMPQGRRRGERGTGDTTQRRQGFRVIA